MIKICFPFGTLKPCWFQRQASEKIESRENGKAADRSGMTAAVCGFVACLLALGSLGRPIAAQAVCQCIYCTCDAAETNQVYPNQEPVDLLTDLEAFYKDRCSISTNGKDNIGNVYRKYLYSASYYNEAGKISFYLGGAYSRLDGTVFLREKKKSTKYHSWLKVYGDGRLLYSSPEFTAKALPSDFTLDVSGVSELELRIDVDVYGSGGGIIGVGDLMLYN